MTEERIEAHNVSLYSRDWRDIAQFSEQTSTRSISAALRVIIQEWRLIRPQIYIGAPHENQPVAQPDPAPAM